MTRSQQRAYVLFFLIGFTMGFGLGWAHCLYGWVVAGLR